MKYWNIFYQIAVLFLLSVIAFLLLTQTQVILEATQIILFFLSKGAGG